MATSTPLVGVPTPSVIPFQPPAGYVEYLAQSGDTLQTVGARFDAEPDKIISEEAIPEEGLINPGQILYLPPLKGETTPDDILIYDSDVVYSPSASDFDLSAFIDSYGGRLSTYSEIRMYGKTPAAVILGELAADYSINPRILLSLLELNGRWVTGQPESDEQELYPFHYIRADRGGLYRQAGWAIQQLVAGYYGWRAGTLTEVTFMDKSTLRLAPNLNAGTVAVMVYLAQVYPRVEWEQKLNELPGIHEDLFGDAYQRAMSVEPLFPVGLVQPDLRLPFSKKETWVFTCGLHASWGKDGQPLGALDFAPPLASSGCGNSIHYATAMASGRVVYSLNGKIFVDMDGDNDPHTGWVMLYMHIANSDKVEVGTELQTGDRIGHPSCEGGSSYGIHVHVARMYNGEWVLGEGGLPFVLSGYQANYAEGLCSGSLTRLRDGVVINANYSGSYKAKVCQPDSENCTMSTATPLPSLTPTITKTPTITPISTPYASQTKEP